MRLATVLRTSSATWLALPSLALIVLATSANRATPEFASGHAPAIAAGAFSMLIFAAAATAGCGAWEAARIRRSGVWDLAPWRARYAIAANALWPVFALGGGLMLVTQVQRYVMAGTWPTVPSVPAVLVAVLLPVPYAVIGFAVGCLIRSWLVAVPLMFVGTWFWIGFVGNSTVEIPGTVWLRHVSTYTMRTPDLSQVIAPEALLVPLLFTGSLAGAAALLWLRRRVLVRGTLAAGLALAGVGTCFALAGGWGYQTPMAASGMREVCGKQATPTVCVPELYEERLPRTEAAARQVVERLAAVGVPKPTKVTHASLTDRNQPGVWRMWYAADPSDAELLHSAATAPVPEATRACLDGEVAEVLDRWLVLVSGLGEKAPPAQYPEDEFTSAARQLTERPKAQQRAWFEETVLEAKRCPAGGGV